MTLHTASCFESISGFTVSCNLLPRFVAYFFQNLLQTRPSSCHFYLFDASSCMYCDQSTFSKSIARLPTLFMVRITLLQFNSHMGEWISDCAPGISRTKDCSCQLGRLHVPTENWEKGPGQMPLHSRPKGIFQELPGKFDSCLFLFPKAAKFLKVIYQIAEASPYTSRAAECSRGHSLDFHLYRRLTNLKTASKKTSTEFHLPTALLVVNESGPGGIQPSAHSHREILWEQSIHLLHCELEVNIRLELSKFTTCDMSCFRNFWKLIVTLSLRPPTNLHLGSAKRSHCTCNLLYNAQWSHVLANHTHIARLGTPPESKSSLKYTRPSKAPFLLGTPLLHSRRIAYKHYKPTFSHLEDLTRPAQPTPLRDLPSHIST